MIKAATKQAYDVFFYDGLLEVCCFQQAKCALEKKLCRLTMH